MTVSFVSHFIISILLETVYYNVQVGNLQVKERSKTICLFFYLHWHARSFSCVLLIVKTFIRNNQCN
jgi:hypothetical protein